MHNAKNWTITNQYLEVACNEGQPIQPERNNRILKTKHSNKYSQSLSVS